MTKQANINTQSHWEKIYSTKVPTAFSWYRVHLETSTLIERAAGARSASIVDVGGESTLVDDLLARGYQNIDRPGYFRNRDRRDHVIVSTFGPEGPSAAVSMSCATTKNRCTNSSACASA